MSFYCTKTIGRGLQLYTEGIDACQASTEATFVSGVDWQCERHFGWLHFARVTLQRKMTGHWNVYVCTIVWDKIYLRVLCVWTKNRGISRAGKQMWFVYSFLWSQYVCMCVCDWMQGQKDTQGRDKGGSVGELRGGLLLCPRPYPHRRTPYWN